jgi:hypothetical protein
MERPAVVPASYLVSAAPKIASPAPAPAPAARAVARASVIILDDSGWRPARD